MFSRQSCTDLQLAGSDLISAMQHHTASGLHILRIPYFTSACNYIPISLWTCTCFLHFSHLHQLFCTSAEMHAHSYIVEVRFGHVVPPQSCKVTFGRVLLMAVAECVDSMMSNSNWSMGESGSKGSKLSRPSIFDRLVKGIMSLSIESLFL